MSDVSYLKLERATNYLLQDLYSRLPSMLDVVDDSMRDDDLKIAEILGPEYGPIEGTPKPSTWRVGNMPHWTSMMVEEYPVVGVWGHQIIPRDQEGGDWAQGRGRVMVQAVLLSSDLIYLARYTYRYAAAIQEICKNTTFGGLADESDTAGKLDISMVQFREYDNTQNKYYAQSVIYQFDAEFVLY